MKEASLPERAGVIGKTVTASFRQLATRFDFVKDARGLGAMCGLELDDTSRANSVLEHALERGLLLMTANGNVIRTLMPLVISDEELERGLDILEASLASAS